MHQARLADGSRAVESVTEVVRAAGGAGVRELYRRGGEPRAPGPGRLARADRAAAAGGGGVSAAAALAGVRRRLRARSPCATSSARDLRRARHARSARALADLVEVVVTLGREGRDPGAAERRRLLLAGAGAGLPGRAGR